MASQQRLQPGSRTSDIRPDGSLDGRLFVAGVAIGVAPAVAAAGVMLGSSAVGFGLTGVLTLIGIVIAAASSEL
jgi:hypothetical protein